MKRVGKLTHAFYGCDKVKKTFWFCDLFIFQRQFIFSSSIPFKKGRERSKLDKIVKGVPFAHRRNMKPGVTFLSKVVYKR